MMFLCFPIKGLHFDNWPLLIALISKYKLSKVELMRMLAYNLSPARRPDRYPTYMWLILICSTSWTWMLTLVTFTVTTNAVLYYQKITIK